MEIKSEDDQLMTRYLLGDISEDDRDRIEERFFADESYYQNLLLAEDDLIYDYLRGALRPDQHKKIESRRAVSVALNRKVRAVESLMHIDVASICDETSITEASPPGWRQTIAGLFVFRKPAIGLAVASALLIASAGYYLVTETGRLRTEIARIEAERETERLDALEVERRMRREIDEMQLRSEILSSETERQKQLRAEAQEDVRRLRSNHSTVASFILMPGITRGRDEPERLVIPKGIRRVEFKLDLEGEEKHNSFRVELRTTGGNLMWSQVIRSASETASGKTVAVRLPASILINGEYEITLLGSTGAEAFETVYYYYFIAMKR